MNNTIFFGYFINCLPSVLGSSRAEPSRLDASNWLHLNRDAWGIESGLHQRLDVSHNDDRCRVRNDNAMLVLGMML